MSDEQIRQDYRDRQWRELQRARAEKLGKRKGAGRPCSQPVPLDALPRLEMRLLPRAEGSNDGGE